MTGRCSTEHGLNVARQPDNGANPRPDNRSGWLDGEAPRTPVDELIDSRAEADFWDPVDAAPGDRQEAQAALLPAPGRAAVAATRPEQPVSSTAPDPPVPAAATVGERLDAIREDGLFRRMRTVGSAQGPRVELDGETSCCSARTTT